MDPLIISFFGILGNILTCLEYLSPVPTFCRIMKNKSTEDFDCLPYICVVLNSSLWTYYGLIRPDYYVSTVNAFGVLMETIYIIIFLVYATPSKRVSTALTATSLDVGLAGGAILISHTQFSGALRAKVVGSMCLTPLLAMYASPLAILGTVIRTRSVEYMPFWLSFNLFWSSGIWTIYAFLKGDYFLGVPNAIAFCLGSTQLIVYCIYKNAKPIIIANDLSERLIEEGLLHEPVEGSLNQSEKENEDK